MKTAENVRQSFGYLTKLELDTLRELTLALPSPPIAVINIGAGAGTSGLLFAETRDDLTVHTFDITKESSPFGCLDGEKLVFEQAGLSHLWGNRWRQYHGDSKEFGMVLNETPWVDLVFVDGDHSYDGCMGDMTIWGAALLPGGVMAIHDYEKVAAWKRNNEYQEPSNEVIRGTIKPYPGVDAAVNDFMKDNDDYEWVGVFDSLAVIQKNPLDSLLSQSHSC